MNNKKIMVNGFRADVYSDEYSATFRKTGTYDGKIAVPQRAESVKTAEKSALCAKALVEGFDTVEIHRYLHVGYDLRFTMKRRSGTITRTETLTHVGGVWKSVCKTNRSIY